MMNPASSACRSGGRWGGDGLGAEEGVGNQRGRLGKERNVRARGLATEFPRRRGKVWLGVAWASRGKSGKGAGDGNSSQAGLSNARARLGKSRPVSYRDLTLPTKRIG